MKTYRSGQMLRHDGLHLEMLGRDGQAVSPLAA